MVAWNPTPELDPTENAMRAVIRHAPGQITVGEREDPRIIEPTDAVISPPPLLPSNPLPCAGRDHQ